MSQRKRPSLQLKNRKKLSSHLQQNSKTCIIHYEQNKHDLQVRCLSQHSFNKIHEIADFRRKAKNNEIDFEQLPDILDDNLHGYHRWCYQQFTNISYLKRKIENDNSASSEQSTVAKSKRRSLNQSSVSALFPSDRCIFCDKDTIKHRGAKQYLVKCVTKIAEESIKRSAESKHDFEMLSRVRDVDLVAREAHYHSTCRKAYTRPPDNRGKSIDPKADATTEHHREAFDYLSEHIERNVITSYVVESMTMLRERYLSFMQDKFPESYNSDYKTCKLKAKIERRFGDKIKFWQTPKGELIYSASVATGQALESAFALALSADRQIQESAMIIRRQIFDMHRSSQDLPWPPPVTSLQSQEIDIPSLLVSFLSYLVSGNQSSLSARARRFVNSCSQDICTNVTSGKWMMPKHLALAMTVRHLTGSAELITILNRLGHCRSYSQTLELETAICNAITSSGSILPASISVTNNSVLHFAWDNFDLNEETPTGYGTTHTAHGIAIQEVMDEGQKSPPRYINMVRNKSRTVEVKCDDLAPCFLTAKAGPTMLAIDMTNQHPLRSPVGVDMSDFLWIYCRRHSTEPTVPSWAGWLSSTAHEVEVNSSVVDYMVPVNSPITENATVQHIINISRDATKLVGQNVTIITCDLAVAKKAYALVWQNPVNYSDVVIRLGVFHTLCSAFGTIGKRMNGSGITEVILESGICASGSVNKVMSGKHYNRALRVHKLVLEALERLLLEFFEKSSETEIVDEEAVRLLGLLSANPSRENLNQVLANNECNAFYSAYNNFKDSIRRGEYGATPKFWLSYMDMIWLILSCIKATKENDLDRHISTLYNICPWFFAYDHLNYARYTATYLMMLINLSESNPEARDLLDRNGFSVSRSAIPKSRNAVDITIEQTINRHAKSHGGIIGFSRNYSAYYRWCVTRHSRAQYAEAIMDMAEIFMEDDSLHKEIRPSQIKSSQEAVDKVIQAFRSFQDPFTVENKDELFCLSSGVPTDPSVRNDLLRAMEFGEQARDDFVQKRLGEKTVEFHKPIKRMNLKTFDSNKVVKRVKSTANKLVQIKAERNVFGQLILLSVSNNIDLRLTLTYPLGPVPWSMATPDGFPMKTDKSKLLHLLEASVEPSEMPPLNTAVYVVDGNALLQSMVSIPDNFEALAENVFAKLPKTSRVDFVTDSYHRGSIKSVERLRRGVSKTFLISGPKTKTPRDWKSFMSNDENKSQLIKLLLSEWRGEKYAERLKQRKLYFVCGKECFMLSSADGNSVSSLHVNELDSSQEEADTRIILHCLHVASNSSESSVIVRSPDTDVLLLLVRFLSSIEGDKRVFFDTGQGNKRRILSINDIVASNHEICAILPAFHAFTGCDTTSSFVRRGKTGPLKLLLKNQNHLEVFKELGKSIDVNESTLKGLETYVCAMYGKPTYSDINKLRFDLFSQRYQSKTDHVLSNYDGIDLSLLPPCRDCLHMHILRANYQALIWNSADKAYQEIPSPDGHGWKLDEIGNISFEWTKGEILPNELIDILSNSTDGEVEEEDIEMGVSLDDVVFDDTE